MKSPNLREMEGMISIDLVEAALAQRQFLGLVDENPCLYTGPHVENAVMRYASVFRIESPNFVFEVVQGSARVLNIKKTRKTRRGLISGGLVTG